MIGLNRNILSVLDSANTDVADDDVQIALIGFMPQLLEDLQCDTQAILEQAGFKRAQFEDPNATVSFTKACRLLKICAKATATPHFGLLMGQRFTMSLLGLVEPLMRQSNTVQAALQQFIQYLHLNDRGAVLYLMELNQDEVALGYSVYTNKLDGLVQLFDYAMHNGFYILSQLCGSAWRPKRVSFAHSAPIQLTPYEKQFNAPLYFDAPRTEIVFAKHWLNTLLQSANATQRMTSEREARLLDTEDQGLLLRSVRHAIQTLLLTGDASAFKVCKQMRFHERILRRHLQAQGSSIKQLKTQIRFNLACQLLALTKLSLTEIAVNLGYSDATAFSRAFRKQQSVTPINYRKLASENFNHCSAETA